jgi:hypothetical protein
MPAPNLTVEKLVGHWSHGVAHGYYGGSHDFSLVFLSDGRGAFIHDGWWTYRYGTFHWKIRGGVLALAGQRYADPQRYTERRCLRLEGVVRASYDPGQQRERLDVPLVDEPNDYYLISRDVAETDLHLEYLRIGDGGAGITQH